LSKKSNFGSLIFVLLLLVLIGGVVFVYNSAMFERDIPKVSVKGNGYWNMKKPLEIDMSDESGIKTYRVVAYSGDKEIQLASENFIDPKMDLTLSIKASRELFAYREKELKIRIEAVDASKWNFMKGNSSISEYTLKIDKKKPRVSIVTNSYAISKGGSALVVFKADDINLDKLYIETNYGKEFKPQVFYRDGYYVSLIAWPVMQEGFKASVIAVDKAGNITRSYIPYYLRNKRYRESKIKLKDKFLNGKISDLAYVFAETQGVDDKLEQFKIINETVRKNNEDVIRSVTSKVSDKKIDAFSIHPMHPLKNAAVVAHFGDHRFYYYNGELISSAYHLGLDLASVHMGKIVSTSSATVVFAADNGIYGNMLVLFHGLGLYTLYGHCSSFAVQEGDSVRRNQHIANTGLSGYAMGDHLHFGVLVQGIEVRPQEWMDKQWIRLNISDVIRNAKKIIDRQR